VPPARQRDEVGTPLGLVAPGGHGEALHRDAGRLELEPAGLGVVAGEQADVDARFGVGQRIEQRRHARQRIGHAASGQLRGEDARVGRAEAVVLAPRPLVVDAVDRALARAR
jgi:hypothetical protein